jgi:putative molybdopterin biosynthesis protein
MLHLSIEYKFSKEPTRNSLGHPLLALLESVHATGSIGKAAIRLGRSYRYVWGELKHWESELETDLIVWGRTSKGAELTPQALAFLVAVSQTQVDLEQQVELIKYRVEQCVSVLKRNSNLPAQAH